jgi:hypothetical protein
MKLPSRRQAAGSSAVVHAVERGRRVALRIIEGLNNAGAPDWMPRAEDQPAVNRLMGLCAVSPEFSGYFPLRTILEFIVCVTREVGKSKDKYVKDGGDVNAPSVSEYFHDIITEYVNSIDEWVDLFAASKESGELVKSVIAPYIANELGYISNIPGSPPPEAAVTRQFRMGDAATLQKINSLADDLHVPEGERPAFSQWVLSFRAGGRETTGRAKAEPRLTAAEMEAVARRDSTLFQRYDRYAERLEKIRLPETGIKTVAEYRAAVALVTAYQSLRQRQRELGLKPEPRHPLVARADQERKAKKKDFGRRTAGKSEVRQGSATASAG